MGTVMCVSGQRRPSHSGDRWFSTVSHAGAVSHEGAGHVTQLCRHAIGTLALLITVVGVAGCDIPDRPIVKKRNPVRTPEREIDQDFERPEARWDGEWEAWYAYMRGGQAVGYSHMAATLGTNHADDAVVRIPEPARIELDRVARKTSSIWYDIEDVIQFDRGKAVFLQTLHQVTRESTDGDFLGFWNRLRVGPASSETGGNR